MTLDEKVAQLGGVWVTELVTDDRLDVERARVRLRDGTGHVTRIGASTGLGPAARARLLNDIQRVLVEDTRLGIPAIVHEESVGGFCARDATVFPQAIGLAATWDPALVEAVAGVIREQMLAVGARHTLSPVLDVARDPRWGRVEETYGEDPYLAGVLGTAYVRGLQTDDLGRGVVCTGKHFLAYGLSEGGMNHAPVQLGPRELREVFAEPFAAAIRDAGLASIMNSYSSIDGLPCAGSAEILTRLLRDELGFDGVVVADYFAVALLEVAHRTASSRREAARQALEAGLDLELPILDCYRELAALVASGELSEALVDRSVRRVLRQKLQLGLFERPYVDADAAPAVYDTAEQRALARTLAERVAAARDADGAIVGGGGRPGLPGGCTVGEASEATDLGLTGAQPEPVERVIATGAPTVVVVIGGRVFALPWIAEHAAALLYAWLPGEEGGNAIADVLFGAVNPSGRLPVSLPRSVGQVPVYYRYRAGGGRSTFHGDYTDSPATPLFPFGHGLSYTTFAYDRLAVRGTSTSEPIEVSVRVG